VWRIYLNLESRGCSIHCIRQSSSRRKSSLTAAQYELPSNRMLAQIIVPAKRAANGACSQYLKQTHGIVGGLYPSRSRGDLTTDFLPRTYLILTRQALQDPPINVRNKQEGLPSPCLNPSLSERTNASYPSGFSRLFRHRLRHQIGLDLAKPPRLIGGSALKKCH
jgi:hypothetical protein